MNFCLLVFVFVWFCLVLCFCCFAVRFGFCFLLCNSETDHGFSPCHTAKPGTGTVLSKVIFQRPSVWTWSVMACGQKHHWWNDIFFCWNIRDRIWRKLIFLTSLHSYRASAIAAPIWAVYFMCNLVHAFTLDFCSILSRNVNNIFNKFDCYCYGYYARNSAQWSKRHPVKVCLILLPYWHPVLYFSKWGLLSSAIKQILK